MLKNEIIEKLLMSVRKFLVHDDQMMLMFYALVHTHYYMHMHAKLYF